MNVIKYGNNIKFYQAMLLNNTFMTISLINQNGSRIGSAKFARFSWDDINNKMYLKIPVSFEIPAGTSIRGININSDTGTFYTIPVEINVSSSNSVYTLTKVDVIL